MVLQDLGDKILNGLNKLNQARNIDKTFYNAFIKEIVAALREADVSTKTILAFMKSMNNSVQFDELPPGVSARKIIEREVLNSLISILDPGKEPYHPEKGRTNVYMMVGLQGAGKTTTCAKLGSYYKRRGWKVAVVAADTFRAGAREQLMQNAQAVHIDYYVDFLNQDPVEVALAGVEKFRKERYDLVIVDTSGRHMQEAALFAEMQQLEEAIDPDEVIFVLDGTIGQAAFDQATGFSKAVDVGSIIVTKLDSNAKGGGALSAVAATESPIAYYGTGEDMTALEVFDARSFVSRMLGFGDGMALARKMEEIDLEKQAEVAKEIMSGHFTFKEMYTQYETILGMGDLSSLVETMGMSKFVPKGVSTDNMADNVKKMLVVIDSMTEEEMTHPELLRDENRKKRICRGCGMPPMFIQYVVDEQKRWAKMFRSMPKNTLNRLAQMDLKGGQGMMDPRTMKQDLQNMAKSMDPRMLQQFGGMSGLSNIMQKSMQAAPKGRK